MDSETQIANLKLLGDSVFPDTTKVFFTGEDATLKELLDQRAPLGADRKVPIEYIPDPLIQESSFSGSKIASVSNFVVAERNAEVYIPFDEKVYDHEGTYLYDQSDPPGGYKFCVAQEGIYGVSLELKFTNSAEVSTSTLKVKLKVERADGNTYEKPLFSKTVKPGEVENLFSGVVEFIFEPGDCMFFVLEQDAIGGLIHGGFETQSTIHKVVKVPDGSGGGGTIVEPSNCPSNVTTDITIEAPVGYTSDPVYDIVLAFDNANCAASLTGHIELPEPAVPDCEPNAVVSCIANANASPEDLGIVFSQEQIMAIVGGFTTLTQFNAMVNTVTKLEGYMTDIFGSPTGESGSEHYDSICNIVDDCS